MKPSKEPGTTKSRRPARIAAAEGVEGDESAARKHFPIVGIGASAGGLEAIIELLRGLPVDTGMAFVLVQHLDPDHASALTQILTRATAMPVREVTDNLAVEANQVYVIPPNSSMAIHQGVLKLHPRQSGGPFRSIDAFFESLANDQHERAVGVILSGSASDGTLGLEAIKAEDGITFAQDASARYDSMPRSATAAGCVDFVLPPRAIAKELVRIARHPYLLGEQKPAKGREPGPDGALRAQDNGKAETGLAGMPTAGNGLKKVLVLLRNHSGVDFSLYKLNTIERRITRRVVLNKLTSLDAYAKFLRGNTAELDLLFGDVLINVTSFFRNPEAFEALQEKVFPKLLEQRKSEPLRFWVLGCSTGQEAYSLAMAFFEYAEGRLRAPKLSIFATDLNDAPLHKARAGFYPQGLVQEMPPERLRRFFTQEDGGYRVVKKLRDAVIFARQNVLNDPPFARMDLISCRNLMIYLDSGLQQKMMPMFHYALNPAGFLFLGASESVGSFTDLFEPLDRKHKIYVHRPGPKSAVYLPIAQRDHSLRKHRQPARTAVTPQRLNIEINAQREADRVALNRYAPAGVLVNAEMQILQFRGDTSAYLKPPTGKASFNLLNMAREGVMLPLRAALQKAKREKRPVRRENLRLKHNGLTRTVHFEVTPLTNLQAGCFLIFFEEVASPARAKSEPPEKAAGRKERARNGPSEHTAAADAGNRIAELERELAETRDFVQSIQEQYEATNEELQASNEEVTSANEELQSVNEELETSKEELESTNEELLTVNEELGHRNAELGGLNSDLVNFQAAANMAIVLVSADQIVRRFTAKAAGIFNLTASDVGRPLSGVRMNIEANELGQIVADVITTLKETEREVRDKGGRWYSMRVRPYRTVDNTIDGAVLVLADIDALKRSAEEIGAERTYAETILRSTRDLLLVLHADLRVHSANEPFYETFHLTPTQVEGRLIYDVGEGEWNIPELRKLLEELLPQNRPFSYYEAMVGRRTVAMNGRVLSDAEGQPRRILLGMHDLTEQKEAEARMRRSEVRYRRLFEAAKDGVLLVDPRTQKILDANPFMTELLKYTREELEGREVGELGIPDHRDAWREMIERLLRDGVARRDDLPLLTKRKELRDVEFIGNVYQENGESIIQCNIRDITGRKRTEESLRQSELRYRTLAQNIPQLIWSCTPDGECDYLNGHWADYTGRPLAELLGQGWLETAHAEDRARAFAWMRTTQERPEVFKAEFRLRDQRGDYRWFEMLGAPLSDERGRLIRWLGTCTDIDDRKRGRAELEKTVADRTAALQETVHELEAFSYSISHDLRAPLRAMNNFAQILSDSYGKQLDDRGRDFLKRISSASERLDVLIQDVLSYARILRTPSMAEPVNLDKLFHEIIETYPNFQAPHAEVRIEGALPEVLGHRGFLTQCFANLVQNAVKFVAPGVKPSVKIWSEDVRTEEAGIVPMARIWVEDNGIGIAPENQDRIFRMFERMHSQREYEGTGIGLTIVRKVAERMGGRVGFESKLGEGSRFWVELRRAEARDGKRRASARKAK